MKRRRPFTVPEVKRLAALHGEGLTLEAIGKALGRPAGSISGRVASMVERGELAPRRNHCRPRQLKAAE